MLPKITVLILLFATSCTLVSPSKTINKTEVKNEVTPNCKNLSRPLNPTAQPTSSASDLDRYFYLAFDRETGGDFDGAILNYRKAAQLSSCDCDRLHAQAGEKAAREAKKLFKEEGMAAKPTQFFWGRLQVLTQALPCVKIE